ncbi:MAG: UDP-N-acetylglucosamine 2-epimerase (non-hydrolyzing) [Actinomycetota bacterium]|nr:UDP-N-acetylglucosamine 2-epimerase (non-hydrolyzing) [Actinomycetota bacterium]
MAFGTRPEIVKLAEVIRLLGPAARLVHTGQHYDRLLAASFFEQLEVPAPDAQLEIGGISRGQQIGQATRLLDRHLVEQPALAVVVQGDTNTTLGAALAANATRTPLVHIEAGLRSFDRAMPEEHNRVVADHLADLCCTPTEVSRGNLEREGIEDQRIEVTGNTIVEAVHRLLPGSAQRRATLDDLGLGSGRFVLATFHRPENVDDRERLRLVLEELAALPLPVVLPLHPRTARRAAAFRLEGLLGKLTVIDPAGYRQFLSMAAECAFSVSDSGGLQEEASILKRPVIVVRNSTERPEVLGSFAELVRPGPSIGEVAAKWLADLGRLHDRLATVPSPYGDGTASQRSVEALGRLLQRAA